MSHTKEFEIEKHLSRLVTNVSPSEVSRIETSVSTNELADIIKNAMKLDTLGQYEEALSWYDKALKINPKDTNTMFKKALVHSKLGMYEQAIFWFDSVLEIDPTLVSALVNRKVVLNKLGKHYGVVPISDKQFL